LKVKVKPKVNYGKNLVLLFQILTKNNKLNYNEIYIFIVIYKIKLNIIILIFKIIYNIAFVANNFIIINKINFVI